MVIGTLALLWYFVMVAVMGAGQRLRREPEETKSCRTGGICTSVRPSVRPSVRMSVCPPVSPSPPGPSEADPGPSETDPGLSEADPGLSEAGPGLSESVLPAQGQGIRIYSGNSI